MSRYRRDPPQLRGGLYLGDGGIETDLIFHHGIEIPHFATHTLLAGDRGRRALAAYFRPFLALAEKVGAGFVLSSQTWKAHAYWATALGCDERDLRRANEDSIAFISRLRDEAVNRRPIVLNGVIGPRGDGYSPAKRIPAGEAEDYHGQQIGWLAATPIDMVTAATFTHVDEAIGAVRAAGAAGLPIVVSFTLGTDGALPSGEPLGEAIVAVDAATSAAAAYFMVNCAHPDHFFHLLADRDWSRRLRGVSCNASRLSHAELDGREALDDGDPAELAHSYAELRRRLPWLNVFRGCCGTDLRHLTAIAHALSEQSARVGAEEGTR